MQTFLPHSDYYSSLTRLDPKRLGKQRVEAFQIYNTLIFQLKPWSNHPAVLMWRGYESSLAHYYNLSLEAWSQLGYQNVKLKPISLNGIHIVTPPWVGEELFHSSHRAALLYKDYEWYKIYGWKETPELNYYWPTKNVKI